MTDAVTTMWMECTSTTSEGAVRMDRAEAALDARMTQTDITLTWSGMRALRADSMEWVVDGMD